jgi:hypothetical protein
VRLSYATPVTQNQRSSFTNGKLKANAVPSKNGSSSVQNSLFFTVLLKIEWGIQ